MDPNLIPQLAEGQEDSNDVQGFAQTPVAMGLMWQLAPKLALVKTLPDPPPHERVITKGIILQ